MKKFWLIGISLILIFFVVEIADGFFFKEVKIKTLENDTGEKVKVVQIRARNHFMAGLLRGVSLREEIAAVIRKVMFFYVFKGNIVSYEKAIEFAQNFFIPSQYQEEMRGMAYALRFTFIPELGREVRYEDILLLNLAAEFHGLHCAAIGAKGWLTSSGKVVVARSLDIDANLPVGMSVIEYLDIDGKKIINFPPFPGIIGVVTGINPDKKLFFELNSGIGERGIINGQPIPWVLLGRLLLEEAGSLEEMIELAKQHTVSDPYNPLVADQYNFIILAGDSLGWYPRFPRWDMPPEVEKEIYDKVGNDFIINSYIDLTWDKFYRDLAQLKDEAIWSGRDLYFLEYQVGARVAEEDREINLYNIFSILQEVYGYQGGSQALAVDFTQEKFLFSQAQIINGQQKGAWALNPFELSFSF